MNPPSRIRKILRRSFYVLLVSFAALLGLTLAIFEWPRMYDIADNYPGWTVVKYNDPACPPLRHNGIFVVIPVNSSGRGCTSSPLRLGWLIEFYENVNKGKVVRPLRQTGWGGGGEIWAGYLIPDEHSEAFFVGTEKQLGQSWSQKPR